MTEFFSNVFKHSYLFWGLLSIFLFSRCKDKNIIDGMVVSAETEIPLDSVQVIYTENEGRIIYSDTVYTNQSGSFEVSHLITYFFEAPEVKLTFKRRNYRNDSISFPDEITNVSVNIPLKCSDEKVIISPKDTNYVVLQITDEQKETLSLIELNTLNGVIEDCVTQNKCRLLEFSRYKRQYVVSINKKGEKEVEVYCFCGIPNIDWRHEIVGFSVNDGGNCYFQFTVNLSTKKYSGLSINSEA